MKKTFGQNSGILNYFLSQGDFIALGRIRIWFFSEVRSGSGSGQNRTGSANTGAEASEHFDADTLLVMCLNPYSLKPRVTLGFNTAKV
jgi:hypothetical protein